MKLTAIIPTRGDVQIGRIIDHLVGYEAIDELIITKGDTPYNRYRAAARAKNDWIFIQDDDCITEIQPLLNRWHINAPSMALLNAMTREHAAQYPGAQTLLGFGAIFHRSLLKCFDGFEKDSLFYRESDRIFATVNPHVSVICKITVLAHAHNENRLWKQPDHCAARDMMNRRIKEKTGIEAGCL